MWFWTIGKHFINILIQCNIVQVLKIIIYKECAYKNAFIMQEKKIAFRHFLLF